MVARFIRDKFSKPREPVYLGSLPFALLPQRSAGSDSEGYAPLKNALTSAADLSATSSIGMWPVAG
jgi:hypothetical protein